jgi:putative transposase
MLLVYRYRIKSLTGLLNSQARACNFVWNFCNESVRLAMPRRGRKVSQTSE